MVITRAKDRDRKRLKRAEERAEKLGSAVATPSTSSGSLRQSLYNLNHEVSRSYPLGKIRNSFSLKCKKTHSKLCLPQYKQQTKKLGATSEEYARTALNLLNPRTPEEKKSSHQRATKKPSKSLSLCGYRG